MLIHLLLTCQGEKDLMELDVVPGALVRHPEKPDWGLGQVQSVIDSRVTVNFENAGKVLINSQHIALQVITER